MMAANPAAALTFDPLAHVYRVGAQRVPSVTQLLQPLSQLEHVPEHILDAASAFGTAVHRACELHDKNSLREDSLDAALFPYLSAWKAFCRDYECDWQLIEERVYNEQFHYAGTLDRFGLVSQEPAVVDIKSSTAMSPTVGPQLIAYARALPPDITRHYPVIRRLGVQLKPDGRYMAQRYPRDHYDWSVFSSINALRRFAADHKIVPNFSKEWVNG